MFPCSGTLWCVILLWCLPPLQFEDLSLRDNSTHCLITMVQRFKALTSDRDLYKAVISGTLLPHVKKGLRSKLEVSLAIGWILF